MIRTMHAGIDPGPAYTRPRDRYLKPPGTAAAAAAPAAAPADPLAPAAPSESQRSESQRSDAFNLEEVKDYLRGRVAAAAGGGKPPPVHAQRSLKERAPH